MASADQRAEETLAVHLAYMRLLTTAGGGSVLERDGILAFINLHPLPFLINGVARIDPAAAAQSLVATGLSLFGERGFEVLCLDGRDDDIGAEAATAGLAIGSADPLQAIERMPNAAPADHSSIELRQVVDAAGVADLAAVNQDAVGAYSGFPDGVFSAIFARPATVLAPDIHALVAYEGQAAVATAQIFMHGDIAYVGWVAVAMAAMRRGLGWLVTEAVVNEGFQRGARVAALMASPMGAPLYRKMGFVDVGSLTNAYRRPGEVALG
jgi:ribosomal protein S18 acetylase RimI-like enzyme